MTDASGGTGDHSGDGGDADVRTDPTARALRLLAVLQARPATTVRELAARFEVSPRTVRRDAERLRRLGYRVTARPGPGSGYRLTPGVSVPPLLFEPDEITAVVAGLRLVRAGLGRDDAAVRALRKLDQVLPDRLRRRAAATDLATEVLDDAPPGVAAGAVGVIADAVAADGRVRFGYRDRHDRASTRTVDPYRHVLRGGRWYLVGYDLDRDDWRLFRFDRVHDVERVPGTYRRRPFPDTSLERWLATDFGRRPEPRAQDGTAQDGTAQDGTAQDGTAQDGTARDGTATGGRPTPG